MQVEVKDISRSKRLGWHGGKEDLINQMVSGDPDGSRGGGGWVCSDDHAHSGSSRRAVGHLGNRKGPDWFRSRDG